MTEDMIQSPPLNIMENLNTMLEQGYKLIQMVQPNLTLLKILNQFLIDYLETGLKSEGFTGDLSEPQFWQQGNPVLTDNSSDWQPKVAYQNIHRDLQQREMAASYRQTADDLWQDALYHMVPQQYG